MLIGAISVILTLSLASLVYSGELSAVAPTGFKLALIGAAVLGILVALVSSRAGIIAAPQEVPAAILTLMGPAIIASMPPDASATETAVTIIAAVALAAVSTGVFFLLLGSTRLGGLIRFLPYPVLGGFLAGTGWLLVTGAVTVITDLPPTLSSIDTLLQPEVLIRWLPALALSFLFLIIMDRYQTFSSLPLLLLAAFGLFYLIAWINHTSVAELSEGGWLIQLPESGLGQSLSVSDIKQIQWSAFVGQGFSLLAIFLISAVALLLNASGLELVVRDDIDLNRELVAAGIGNIGAGLFGGLVGYHVLAESSLGHKMGASSRLVGAIAAGLCGIVLLLGTSVLIYIPKLLFGTVLLILGLAFLVEWLYRAWFNFSRIDYLIIITIFFTIALVGFLEGVILGVLLAIIMFVVSYSRIDVVKHALTGVTYQSRVTRRPAHRQLLDQHGEQIYILQLQGFIFFGTANNLLTQLRQRLDDDSLPQLRFLVLDFRGVTGLDASAMLSFYKMKQLAAAQDLVMVLADPSIETHLPGQNYSVPILFDRLAADSEPEDGTTVRLFSDLDRGLEWCEEQILKAAGEDPESDQESLSDQLMSLLPDDAEIGPLLEYFERLDVGPGYYLMRQGDPPDDLFFIESGQVTAQLEGSQRNPVRLETMRGGRVVGEIGFFLNKKRTAAVLTDKPTVLYRLSREAIQAMEQNDPELALALHQGIIGLLSERVTHLITTVTALGR